MSIENTIEMSDVVTQSGSVVSADMNDDEIVMMNVEKGMYYGMEDIESYIWELMEHPLSISQLCDALTERYHVPREVCYKDILEFLRELHEEGLIDIRNPD